ncbi:hypothetical protein [Methanopyrus sp.]
MTSPPSSIALSGGKDSVATLIDAADRWNVKVAVTVVHEFVDRTCLENARKAAEHVGADHEIVKLRLRDWFARALKEGRPVCTKCGRSILTAACLRSRNLGCTTVLTGHELRGKFGRRTVHPYPPGVTVIRYPALCRWTWVDIRGIVSSLSWFNPDYTCPIRPYGVHRFIEEVGYNPLTGRACTIMLEGVATPQETLAYLRETETPEEGPERVLEILRLEEKAAFPNGVPDGPRDEEEIVRDLTYRLLMYARQALKSLMRRTLNRVERRERFTQLYFVMSEYGKIDDRIEHIDIESFVRLAAGDEKEAKHLLRDVKKLMRSILAEYDRRIPGARP